MPLMALKKESRLSLVMLALSFLSCLYLTLSVFGKTGLDRSLQNNTCFASDINTWLSSQLPFSVNAVLNNIHPDGTVPGTVVASTSKVDPPYWFHWTRDAALTMDVVVNFYVKASGQEALKYEQMMWDYAKLSKRHQSESGCAPKSGDCQGMKGFKLYSCRRTW